jgi:hypothetical protein
MPGVTVEIVVVAGSGEASAVGTTSSESDAPAPAPLSFEHAVVKVISAATASAVRGWLLNVARIIVSPWRLAPIEFARVEGNGSASFMASVQVV